MIPAVILAAGGSTRMGRPKALLPLADGGETFLSRLVHTMRAAGVEDIVVVVGHDAATVREAATGLAPPPRIVENPAPDRGQLSSLQAALRVIDRPGVNAVLAVLVDAPLVAPDTVRRILDAYRRTGCLVARPTRGGRHGHPVVFDRRLFDDLLRADLGVGAGSVVRAAADRVFDVAVDDDGAFLDIDTPEDYEQAIGRPFPRA